MNVDGRRGRGAGTDADESADLPMDADDDLDRGNALADAGQHPAAIQSFRRAQRRGVAGMEVNIGNSFVAMGDVVAAEREFRAGWLAGDADAGFNLAALLERGGYASARGIYRALAADGYAPAAINEAWNLVDEGRIDESVVLLESASRDPEWGDLAAGSLGRILWRTGDSTGSEPHLRRGAAVDPSARADLGHLLVSSGRRDEGLAVWRLGAESDEVESMVPLANDYSRRGMPVPAGELYRRAWELGDAHAATNLAIDYWNRGMQDSAITWARMASAAGDIVARDWLRSIDSEGRPR